ncbi:hypothetical protein K8I28_07535 [bacterium]|nr:hypothetical protein [bacterium]
MRFLEDATVLRNTEIRPGIWSMWVEAPLITDISRPGQFVHIRVDNQYLPLLRRPLSIGRVHETEMELVWRVIGKGTAHLARLKSGETINLLGPTGEPFKIDKSSEMNLLVGGGLGLPPMVYLFEHLKEAGLNAKLLLGVKNEGAIPLADSDTILTETEVIAEEGGKFRHGLVTEPVVEYLEQFEKAGISEHVSIYICGPWGMIAAMQKVVPEGKYKITQVSLEQQMGCGVGVCQGCAVKADGGETPYRLVCTDGPVFDLFEVEAPK